VFIETDLGVGTGFIIDKTGLVATNLHVVRGKREIRIKLYGGDIYPVTQVVGVDPGRDLALLRILPTKVLPALRLGDSDAMVAGDQIVAIGNPLGVFDYSVSSGLVSQIRPVCTTEMVALHNKNIGRFEELLAKPKRSEQEDRELGTLQCIQELKILQISAPISQGSSGGPLFNQSGEVVGVTTAIVTAGQNINLAIPANYLKQIVARPDSMTMDEFAKRTAEVGSEGGEGGGGGKVERQVPDHPLTLLDGCTRDQISDTVKAIWEAIELGAPLYNKGNLEKDPELSNQLIAACFRIYEGVATKFQNVATCKGIKQAFDDGVRRAGTLSSYKLKAWAMRDTFDGLLGVSEKWARANAGSFPTPPPHKK
jgi:hypothetical protein